MYTILLFFGIVAIIHTYKEVSDFGWSWDLIPLSFLVGILGAVFGFFVAVCLPMDYKKSHWEESIISLKDNSSFSGHVFLGSGQINGKMVYVYYQKNKDDTYQMWQADYWKCKIRYTNGSPKIIIDDISFEKNTWNKWAIDVADECQQRYIFEIPEGSIKSMFELDSQ